MAAGPSAQRLDAHCRAAERRLDAAALVDWRLDLAAELKQRGRSAGDEAPAPELGEDGKRLLARLLTDRATAAMLEGEVAGMAAGDGAAAASPEARQQAVYARRARDLREREAKRRSELIAELEPQLGSDAAAGVVVLPPSPAAALDEAAGGCLRRLVSDRKTAAMLEGEVAGMAAGDGAAAASPEARQQAVYARRARDLREREAKRLDELAWHLAPVFGRDAEAAAAALADSATRGSGGLVRRGEDGRITASSGALEARQAAGALRLLLTAQRAARVAEDEAGKAARRELQRQLEAADAAISQQPLALRVARGAGAEEAVMASVRKAGKAGKRRREASRGSER